MKDNCLKMLLAIVTVLISGLAIAQPLPEWVSSYNAAGKCFCAPGIQPTLRNKIVATPIGGQSVGQVCERIGEGPTLTLINGEFNYATYHDAQCGNGPTGFDSGGCDGRMKIDDAGCAGIGPSWDLKTAYAQPAPKPASTNSASVTDQTIEKKADVELQKQEVEQAQAALNKTRERALAQKARNERRKRQAARRAARADRLAKEKAEARLAKTLAEKARNEALLAQSQSSVASDVQTITENSNSTDLVELEPEPGSTESVIEDAAEQGTLNAEISTKPEVVVVVAAPEEVAEQSAEILESEDKLANAVAVDKVDVVEQSTDPVIESAAASALRLPSDASLSNDLKGYFELTPVTYDFGGSGAALRIAQRLSSNWDITGRISWVEEYQEMMAGISRSFPIAALDRGEVKVQAGIEYGRFDLGKTGIDNTNIILDSTGVLLDGALGYNVSHRSNLTAGFSYSSFFEGDPSIYGQLLFRFANNLDLTSRIEGGDNTNFRLGVRIHY